MKKIIYVIVSVVFSIAVANAEEPIRDDAAIQQPYFNARLVRALNGAVPEAILCNEGCALRTGFWTTDDKGSQTHRREFFCRDVAAATQLFDSLGVVERVGSDPETKEIIHFKFLSYTDSAKQETLLACLKFTDKHENVKNAHCTFFSDKAL